MSTYPFFVIKKASNGQFYFTLDAPNNETIATSELYTTKDSAEAGIAAVRRHAAAALTIDVTK